MAVIFIVYLANLKWPNIYLLYSTKQDLFKKVNVFQRVTFLKSEIIRNRKRNPFILSTKI
jgi:hypothetical protein